MTFSVNFAILFKFIYRSISIMVRKMQFFDNEKHIFLEMHFYGWEKQYIIFLKHDFTNNIFTYYIYITKSNLISCNNIMFVTYQEQFTILFS